MGSRRSVSRALPGLQDAVCGPDERLAALFALFSRLYRDEEMPAWERLRSRRWLLAAPAAAVATLAAAAGRPVRRAAGRTARGVHGIALRVRRATAHAEGQRSWPLTPGHGR